MAGSWLGVAAAAAVAGLLMVWPARAGSAVEPASCTVTNYRTEGISAVSSAEYYVGSTLRLTTCVAYASGTDTNGTLQMLTNVTIEVTIGNTSTSTVYAGSVTDPARGLWGASVGVSNYTGQLYMQLKLTDENTNSFIYPWKTITKKSAL
jgi:hypothetical protein